MGNGINSYVCATLITSNISKEYDWIMAKGFNSDAALILMNKSLDTAQGIIRFTYIEE